MLISVIIPVYNVSENLFDRALKSVSLQADDKVEIIVVDDGSKQANSDLYQNICSKYACCNYYRTENSGVSAARNYGVQKAKGEYILFVDSDDYITDKCIRQAEQAVDKYHPDVIFGYIYRDLSDGGNINYRSSENDPEIMILNQESDIAAFFNNIFWYRNKKFEYERGYIGDGPWCRLFRKELFSKNKFDEIAKWNEDTLWNIGLLKMCHSIVICKSLWYVYTEQKGSATHKYRKNCIDEFLYITEKVYNRSYSLWDYQIDNGVNYRIWHDLLILSKLQIFNPKNQDPFLIRYSMLKKAIESKTYQKVIRKVNFKCEQRKIVRKIKELLNLTMKMRCYILTYAIINMWAKSN